MPRRKEDYNYKIIGNYTEIYLKSWNGNQHILIIDTEDLERVINYKYKWYWDESIGYVRSSTYLGTFNGKPKYKMVRLHRWLMNIDDNGKVDHINHNTFDNRKCNLRIVNKSQNAKNRMNVNSNNSSGYRNVSWIDSYHKWVVQLQVNGKNKILGKFDDVHEAGAFAETMREKYYGEYAGNH